MLCNFEWENERKYFFESLTQRVVDDNIIGPLNVVEGGQAITTFRRQQEISIINFPGSYQDIVVSTTAIIH